MLLSILWIGCANNNTMDSSPTPPTNTDLVEWVWETPEPGWARDLHIDPLIYQDWIIVVCYEEHTETPAINIYNKYNGMKIKGIEPPGNLIEFTRFTIKDDALILNGFRGVTCLDLPSLQLRWEKATPPYEVGTISLECTEDYVYIM